MAETADRVEDSVSEPVPVTKPRAGIVRRILRWTVAILVLIVLYYAVGFWA